jgi:hypothetical protein
MHPLAQNDQVQQHDVSSKAAGTKAAPPGITSPASITAAVAAASPSLPQVAASADTAADIDVAVTQNSPLPRGEAWSLKAQQQAKQDQQRRQLQQVAMLMPGPAADDPLETKMRQVLQQLKSLQEHEQQPALPLPQQQLLQQHHQQQIATRQTHHLQEMHSGSIRGGSFTGASFTANKLQSLQQLLAASPGPGGSMPFRPPAALRDQLIEKISQQVFAQIQEHRQQQQQHVPHQQQHQLPQLLLQQCHLLLHQLRARVHEDQQPILQLSTLLPAAAKDLTTTTAAAATASQPSVGAGPDAWQQQLRLLLSSPGAPAAAAAAAAAAISAALSPRCCAYKGQ